MTSHPLVSPPSGRLGLVEFVEPVVRAALAARLAVDPDWLRAEVTLDGDLAADPLDVLETVIAVERRLAIAVHEADIDRVRTIADLVRIVAAALWARDHVEPFTSRVSVIAA